jgi:hypothetical protein
MGEKGGLASLGVIFVLVPIQPREDTNGIGWGMGGTVGTAVARLDKKGRRGREIVGLFFRPVGAGERGRAGRCP